MALTIKITGSVTLDESLGLQNSGVAVGSEDNNDSDVLLSTLQSGASSFYNRLFDSAGLGLSTTFPTANGVAESADDFITVSDGTATSLGFVDGSGGALPVYGGVDPGVATNLEAVDGGSISLFADSVLGNRMVLGVDEDGDIVFAIFMDPTADLTAAKVWMVQFEAVSNPDGSDPDDPVNLIDSIGVAATSPLEFNFDELPSGANLFGVVGDPAQDSALIVIGENIDLKAGNKYSNTSDTIHTSQGGEGATIGVNNQLFDHVGEGAYFTFVNNPDPNYLSGVPGGLTATEADDADNIQYDGGTLETNSAFFVISQMQGNDLAHVTITPYNIADAPQGTDFVDNLGTNDGPAPLIEAVRVFDETGTKIEDTGDLLNFDDQNVSITITNGVADVSGLDAGYRVEWDTNAVFDQVLIENQGGQFDIGAFGSNQSVVTSVDVGNQLRLEDDGPTIGGDDNKIADSLVDFAVGSTATQSLEGSPGTDDHAAYTITDFTGSIDVNGVTVTGVLSDDASTVNYFSDDDGTPGFTQNDTIYYTLALDQTDSGAYNFTVNAAPAAPPLEFNFDELPSGANLFGVVGDPAQDSALIVIGENIDLKAGNKYSNTSDTIHTSQGGEGATIGVNNQLFDHVGEGAYFTFVNNPDPNYLSGVPGGLTATEADDADNIQYDGGTLETNSAFFVISQMQGNDLAHVTITPYNIADAPQGTDFVDNLGTNDGPAPLIEAVRVFDETGTKIEDTGDLLNFDDQNVSITITNGVADVSGLDAGYRVEWDTNAVFDQVLIENQGGQFDIGAFGSNQPQDTPDQKLDFTAQIADGDTDTSTASFSIGIDGTGVFNDNHVDGVNA